MVNSINDKVVLSNGVEIPAMGYGTWQTPDGDAAENGVVEAIKIGFRHIDTAIAYGNEVGVGNGIKKSGVKREDIFLTTKHWITDRGYEKTKATIDVSLKNLGVDYLDLYLIHWPCVEKVSKDWEYINAETWRGFEDAVKAGKIRAIGVSNFQKKHIDALMKTAEIAPAVNQIEFHPGFTQMDNVRFSQDFGMVVEAWSPLGCGAVLGDLRLAEIAAKYNKSVSQLCLRFAVQNGIIPLSKSLNPEHIKSNTEIFDFEISDSDMAKLFEIDGLGYSGYAPEDAPADVLYG